MICRNVLLRGSILYFGLPLFLFACGNDDDRPQVVFDGNQQEQNADYSYLALGDSYTVGEGVQTRDSFPVQLIDTLELRLEGNITLDIVATTGWTTSNLINGIESRNLPAQYDLVTVLIGVNNQFQGQSFSEYETQFPKILDLAIALAKSTPERVYVLSIPDYSFTPAGGGDGTQGTTSQQIDEYNAFAKTTAQSKNVKFLTITDISRRGIDEPNLVAEDNLHLSGDAYEEVVARLFSRVFGLFL